MTSYQPNPVVTFADVNVYSDNTIAAIQINMGRSDVLEQPQAGYARIALWTDANEPLNVNLSDSVTVKVDSALYGEPTRTNLIPNPSFETNATGWNNAQSAGVTRSTTYSRTGVASGRATMSSTTDSNIFFIGLTGYTHTYATTGVYTMSAYFYIPTGSTLAGRTVSLTQEGGTASVTVQSSSPGTLVIGSWVRVSQRVNVTTAGTTFAVFRLSGTLSTAVGQTIYIDSALEEKSSTLNDYFDGSTLFPIVAAWTGTANASTSTLTPTQSLIFTGIISDLDINLAEYGDAGSIAEYTITAIGPLAQLNKRSAGATNYSIEKDGTRVYNILRDAFLTAWDDVGGTITWDTLPNDVTWASYDGVNEAVVNNLATTIDVPGTYELDQYNDGPTNALALAQLAAQSGRGVLYEAGNGHLHYGDYGSRVGQTPLVLTADDLLTNGLNTEAQWSEIVNDAEVIYGSGSKYARDETSVILYGQLNGSRTTVLHHAADAQTQADAFIASRAYPRTYPNVLTVALHNPEVSDATRDALIAAENGTEVYTSSLPAVFGTIFSGYVEGYTWNLTRYEAFINLICSAVSETYPHVIWYQIPPTTTWSGYTPSTTKWSDL